jgi:hypothetical protein
MYLQRAGPTLSWPSAWCARRSGSTITGPNSRHERHRSSLPLWIAPFRAAWPRRLTSIGSSSTGEPWSPWHARDCAALLPYGRGIAVARELGRCGRAGYGCLSSGRRGRWRRWWPFWSNSFEEEATGGEAELVMCSVSSAMYRIEENKRFLTILQFTSKSRIYILFYVSLTAGSTHQSCD